MACTGREGESAMSKELRCRLVRNTVTSMISILRASHQGEELRYPSKHEVTAMAKRLVEYYPMLQDEDEPIKHMSMYSYLQKRILNVKTPQKKQGPRPERSSSTKRRHTDFSPSDQPTEEPAIYLQERTLFSPVLVFDGSRCLLAIGNTPVHKKLYGDGQGTMQYVTSVLNEWGQFVTTAVVVAAAAESEGFYACMARGLIARFRRANAPAPKCCIQRTTAVGNWLKRSSLSGLTDGVEDLLDISSVDRLSFIRQSSKVKFTSAVKLSESGAVGPEYARDEEENFFKRLGPHGFQERLAASQEAMKNKNVVNLGAIRQGMKRFQFLLNCCEPGTIPDASILAAALDLEAPVVARASLFLECARFVHRCNRGNWPEWMKGHHVNITKRGLSRGRSPIVGNKRNQKLQWNAAKYFCQWGDAIGTRLSELCHSDSESPANILGYIFDEETKRRMRKEDEEEDYLDDNTVNPTKCGCPFALKMAACQLLLEITTFLRETFPCLPRPRTEPLVDLDSCRLRLDPELGRHRYERKISFAGILDDEDGHDSLNSSSHTLKSDTTCDDKKTQEAQAPIRKIRIGGSRLLQIKGARSFRVKKGGSLTSIRRAGSLKSTKLSRQDSESENEEGLLSQTHSRDTVTDIGSPFSTSEPSIEPEGPSSGGAEDNYHSNMSWLHIMILLCNQQSFICTHIDFCHPRCYQHHSRSCARLVRAIKLVYGETVDSLREDRASSGNIGARAKKNKECSDKSCLRTPSMKRRPTDSNTEGKKDTGMLKYIRNQVMSLSPAPLSLLIKAASILTADMYGDVQPAAWELLLSVDEHMAAAAAAMFLLCAVKVSDAVTEMMMAEFHHQEACQRINSILKFYTLWRFRYQVWPRMEEGAQQIFKIPPPSINFTLPSPILGMPCVPIFDPPGCPRTQAASRTRSMKTSLVVHGLILVFSGNWLKRSSLSGLTDGVEDLLDISSVDRLSFIRQSSKVKFTSAVKLSESGAVGPEYARDEEENFFKRLGPHGFQERLAASQEAMKNKNVVNLGAIRQGMKRFQFLLNCCEPGTIPDASILAAALDLEAPVVARASLFLECARFVHRCNRGNWPEWMKGHHVNITKRGLSRGRSPIVGNKRNQKLQWNAAKYFCQWGDAIGTRLSELCHSDSESPANILGYIFDEETKRRMRKEDEEEDYLDDNTVNPTKCGCPFALKMAACQLLLEITTFLRETFPCLPRPRTEPLVDLDSCRLRLDPELGRHRYERKISFAGILDDEDGHDSLNSSSHTLKSDTTCDDKKTQEAQAPIRKIRIGGSRLLQIKGARSFRVKKGGSLTSIRRAGSLKSTKLSRQDSESENEEGLLSQTHSRDTVTDIGSPFSTSEPSIEPEGPSSGGAEDNYHSNMSWLHIMILLCNQQSFICTHIDFCHPRCYQHHSRSCARLVRAIKLVYGETVDSLREDRASSGNIGARAKKNKECSDKSCLRTPSMKRRPTDSNTEGKKDTGMLKYIRNQVMSLSPAPLSLLIKAASILTADMYGDVQPAAWELLLSVDEHMAAAAAAMFLLCAVKVSDAVTEMMMAEFHHQEACQRINSILKFYTLWRFRYQVWPRMEEGAQQIFKIPPPSINFTLPSPILGMPCVPIFDPPWVPQNTGSVQDPINEDQSKSFSARAVSRSHQRAEHILKNLQQEEEKRRLGREASIITAIPVAQEACYEPTCSPPPEQEEEAEEVVNLASRRLSVSPSCASSNSHRNYSFRRGSVWSVRSLASAEDEENTTEHTPTHHMLQPPQAVFPACICAAVLPIVHLMEDGEVREDGVAVSAVAQQILWNCLIEDPALVLRHFLEKLTVSNRQDELMYMLRKLLLNIGDLPAQTSHILFNYLVGLIMYFVRTPCEWGMDAISATLTFLWEVVGYVEGLFFKDLKQTMKKEQCEVKLLVTASMPGTKTLVVHGQNECDIPTQLPVHEDTQFEALLKECLEFFNIPEARSAHYFLMDKRWNLIHYSKTYVRDIYPFRRSVSPQLNLVHMLPEKGQELIQKQVFSRKLEEVGRVLFLISLTQHMPAVHKQSHVSLLQEDLLRLPSFPRTAIDAEFSLFNEQQGKELFGLDTLHKVLWIKLLEEMFLGMPSEYPWGDEMMLFLNVFNGALLLHPEDSSLLRQYTATAINTAVHFNHLFSLSGYQWILPTMLQVYADYESDPLLRQGIEFCCRQFYILHRKPFILQLFASVAPLLEFTTSTSTGLSKGVSAQCLFDLLVSLEGETQDALDALELVKAEKPLRSLDFCYGNEDLTFSISEAIKLCVTVVAYAPESFRSLQMLMVLEALVPCHLQKLKSNTVTMESASAARDEIAAIAALATSLQALLYSSEALTRPMTAPQMSRCDQGHKGGTTANHAMSGGVNTRDNLHLLEEGQGMPREELDERIAREEFRRPRESLLNICTEFYKHCGPRLKILQNVAGEPRVTALELLDIKSHMRLAEIAHALLKLAPYDTLTMESRGLRRYIMEMLPITDWSSEAVRPALILILKRLDRMFNKIHKMPTLRRQVEWEAASSLIEGLCLTLQRQPIISFLPHLRSLINVCVNLVMGVVGPSSVADGLPLLHLSPYLSPPLPFSTAVVRLVALQIQALKEDFPLSHVISPFTNQERREGMLLNLLIPFVLTVGSGSKDSPHLEQPEIFLLLQTVINILLPPRIISTSRTKNFMLDASPAHCSTPGDTGKDLRREGLAESTSQAAYLALKVVLVCFERSLGNQWYRLSLQVKEMALRKVGGLAFWDFIDFIVRTRIPIFVLLRPFIQCKLLTQPADSQEEITARHHIADQLERRFIPRPLCKSSLFAEFNNELKILKEAVHSGSAYQGKTSISTVGTSTSAYRLSLATMSRSNTGTGTVWEQDSQPSRQPSQDTLSRTDEDDEENDSMSIPSVVSEHEAFLPRVIAQRRFSSHATGSAASQPEAPRTTMLPSHSEPNVLDESQGLLQEGNLSRVASVQSEPGQQNLLIQPPLGRKRGLRQRTETRRPGAMEPKAEARTASPALSKSPTLEVPSASSATVTADLHGPANAQEQPRPAPPHPSQRNNCRIISGTDSNRTGASRGYAPCHEQDSNWGLSGLRGSAPCHATLDHYTTAASELKHISGRF
ncbi:Protein unc-80 -like protein [Collichthys lucidus]|uniref:Protein unc-80-like protein n=1 Tax=Collichthys lucidus TaxID=240159 RepID=A0A4U5TVT9_COLLU|nr:Protein unc-80 -like protein [Collichthys lucidus]